MTANKWEDLSVHGKIQSETGQDQFTRQFLDPKAGTIAHGRPIYSDEAKSCGLTIKEIDVKGELWEHLYQLYVRSDQFVTRFAAKMVESKDDAFYVRP